MRYAVGRCWRRLRRLGGRRGRCGFGFAHEELLEPPAQSAVDAMVRGDSHRSRSRRGQRSRLRHDRSRRARQQCCNGRHLRRRPLVAGAAGLDGLGRSRHEIARLPVFGQIDLIVPDAPDGVPRRLHVGVRDDHELCGAAILEGAQPLALLVEEIGGHFHRQLGDDSHCTVLAQLLTDQTQHRESHRLDAADAADADAPRADDVARLPE